MANGVAVDLDMVVYSCPPPTLVYTYNNMWAYGNHYKVDVETKPTHATYDSGVACIFQQSNCNYVQDKNIIITNLHYVGMMKEIILSVLHWPMCNIDEMFMDTCSHAKEYNNHVTR
jgi:hypothetical protein